jgi:Domain of unknown function (DUF6249)
VREEEVILVIFAMMIFAGIAVLWMAMQSRRRFREMEHRERLAMIERGLVPSPESDPLAFERSLPSSRTGSPVSARLRSAGVILIGFGLALTALIWVAAEAPRIALGIGGAFAMIGLAFIANAMLTAQQDMSYSMSPPLPMRGPARRDSSPPPSSTDARQ